MTAPDDREATSDAETGTYRISHDPTTQNPSIPILEAVATVSDAEPTALDPLDEYADPDALGHVLGPTTEQSGVHGSLSFNSEELLVVVHSDGEIELREQVRTTRAPRVAGHRCPATPSTGYRSRHSSDRPAVVARTSRDR
ncbi:HalOD1 output domain-containing protein [Halorientalis regularis]|jgi:hypothetical protein|uniref:HalOD1 output domain-containing protein n=1 Tax=Halorientalis regularis TaxID=660518 RepID=UPI000B899997|nr:HalOD1 output domain-containing protein [Halorientalis regularis]